MRRLEVRIGIDHPERAVTRGAEQRVIDDEVGHAELGQAVLLGPEKLSGPADFQVLFRDFESVGRPLHRGKPPCRVLRPRLAEKKAVGFLGAAADTRKFVVRVLDPSGEGVARAQVSVLSARGRSGSGGTNVATFDLEADRFGGLPLFVVVSDARDRDGSPLPLGRKVVGPIGTDVHELEIRLEAEALIQGTVLDDDGAPIHGASVEARVQRPVPWQERGPNLLYAGRALSDERGRFFFKTARIPFWFAAISGLILMSAGYFVFAPTVRNVTLLCLFGLYTGIVFYMIYSFSNPFVWPGDLKPTALADLRATLGSD